MRRVRRAAIVMTIALVSAGTASVAADRPSATEYAIKAAIIFKIAKFVSWPRHSFAGSRAPLAICMAPDDPMESSLDALSGKIIHGRPIAIRRIDSIAYDTQYCQIIVLGNSEGIDLVSHVDEKPVLTIGHSDSVEVEGEIVRLITENNRIKFSIDVDASNRAGLNISAQLLQLAATTEPGRSQ